MTRSPSENMAELDEQLPDCNHWNVKFQDLKAQKALLESHNSDLEKSLAVAEAKAERLERELDRAQHQVTDLISKAASSQALIEGIAAQIVNHAGGPGGKSKFVGSMIQAAARTHGNGRRLDEAVTAIGDQIKAIGHEPEPRS